MARVEETDSLDGGGYLLRVVGVVVDVDEALLTDTIVEATAHTGEGLEAVAQLILVESTGECHGGGDDSVLDIDERGAVKLKVEEDTVGCAEIEE